jgi:hypothetical protein
MDFMERHQESGMVWQKVGIDFEKRFAIFKVLFYFFLKYY